MGGVILPRLLLPRVRNKPLRLIPEPLNKRPQLLQLKQFLPGIEVLPQLIFRTCSMNGVMAGSAHPEGAGDQVFFAE